MKRNIVITGATSGLGLALAHTFAEAGHCVIGCGRNIQSLEALRQRLGSEHLFEAVDVSCDSQVQQWAEHVYQAYSHVDVLINNAGIKNPLAPTWEISDQDFKQVLATNVLGMVNAIRHFVPGMIVKNHGTIINMSSEWGRVADAKVAPYCASKFAIEGLTQAFAKELPSNMVVVALSPLIVYTTMLEQCKDLLLPGEYELGVAPEQWAEWVLPKVLGLTRADNGKSYTWSPKA